MLSLPKSSVKRENALSPDYVVKSITEFKYELDESVTSEACNKMYVEIFEKEYKDWDDKKKTRLITLRQHDMSGSVILYSQEHCLT